MCSKKWESQAFPSRVSSSSWRDRTDLGRQDLANSHMGTQLSLLERTPWRRVVREDFLSETCLNGDWQGLNPNEGIKTL